MPPGYPSNNQSTQSPAARPEFAAETLTGRQEFQTGSATAPKRTAQPQLPAHAISGTASPALLAVVDPPPTRNRLPAPTLAQQSRSPRSPAKPESTPPSTQTSPQPASCRLPETAGTKLRQRK